MSDGRKGSKEAKDIGEERQSSMKIFKQWSHNIPIPTTPIPSGLGDVMPLSSSSSCKP